ncbi:endonuclease III [Ructibacterium gallinarum]|uniref:endonuclease III n=1 Tax=Ructibacterium gallinarum TaxID=2779355 RepID=UPI001CF8276A|nr:endonuclease III [Ructibacterium gallinarum]
MYENLDKKRQRVISIIDIFNQVYCDADCTLHYDNALQLLIATQLAAQCTDARVNLVTPALFQKYPDVYAFANADELELQEAIRSTGFFRNKAKNIIACCQMLVKDFGGEVPGTMEELLKLPGVGRKTANLVLGDFFGIPGIVVDTHATRLSNRLGLTSQKDPYKIELDLEKVVPRENWSSFCHQLVYHGRAFCTARSPKCSTCPISHLCPQKI